MSPTVDELPSESLHRRVVEAAVQDRRQLRLPRRPCRRAQSGLCAVLDLSFSRSHDNVAFRYAMDRWTSSNREHVGMIGYLSTYEGNAKVGQMPTAGWPSLFLSVLLRTLSPPRPLPWLSRAAWHWSKRLLLRAGRRFDEEPNGFREGGRQGNHVVGGQYHVRCAGLHHQDHVSTNCSQCSTRLNRAVCRSRC